jgi:hypothetical protein
VTMNVDEWDAFRDEYKLDKTSIELEKCKLLNGKGHYYVKLGGNFNASAKDCITRVQNKKDRVHRRIGSTKKFVFALIELIAADWDDDKMDKWLVDGGTDTNNKNGRDDDDEEEQEQAPVLTTTQQVLPIPIIMPRLKKRLGNL